MNRIMTDDELDNKPVTDEEFAEFMKPSNTVDEIPIEKVKWFLPQEELDELLDSVSGITPVPQSAPVVIDAKMQVILHRALMRSGKVITPPAVQVVRNWVSLTPADYEEIRALIPSKVDDFDFANIVALVDAKLKEKNQ